MKISKEIIEKAKEKTNTIDLLAFEYEEANSLLDDFIDYQLDEDDIVNYDQLEERVSEYADSLVDIYYYDIYKSCSKFSEAINLATDEMGRPETIDKEIQQGQYYAYNNLFMSFVQNLRELDK
jgi:dsDNA-specific endonuclease/ATPase MutS2